MKKLKFKDENLKNQYKNILNNHPALSGILIKEFGLDYNSILINKIETNVPNIDITVNNNGNINIVRIDSLNKIIRIINKKWPYQIIYSDIMKQNIISDGYEYEGEKRKIFERPLVQFEGIYNNEYLLSLNENNQIYNVRIISKKGGFDIDTLIRELLSYNEDINSLRDVLLMINKLIDITYFEVRLSDNYGNMISIDYGVLTNYIEYRDMEDESQKIFLKNNEFLVERRIKEKCDDGIIPFMKKIGVYNGKEKR